MSTKSVGDSKEIYENLSKSKAHTNALLRDIRRAESDSMRLVSTIKRLAMGDVRGLIPALTMLGPKGLVAASLLGIGVAFYKELTKKQPSEVYYWRYPG